MGDSCRNLFKKLDILPLSCEYILSLMLFVIDNLNKFCSGLEVHGLNIRSRNQLYLPISNLSVFQNGTMCTGIRLFNRLPMTIQNLRKDRISFKNKLFLCVIFHFIQSMNFWSIQWTISLNCVLLSCVFCLLWYVMTSFLSIVFWTYEMWNTCMYVLAIFL
jgi:hypothetical protein